MSTIEAGDKTALIQGCGNQLIAGYTYCRKLEGDNTNEKISFVIPSLKCESKDDECASLTIFFPDGTPSYGYIFKKGETVHRVNWSELTKKSSFDVEDRGFWPYIYRMKFIADDGRERETVTEGEIRLRVLRKSYISLSNIKEDINFVWKFNFDNTDVKITNMRENYVDLDLEQSIKGKIKNKISELEDLLIRKNILLRSFQNKGHKIITITEVESYYSEFYLS